MSPRLLPGRDFFAELRRHVGGNWGDIVKRYVVPEVVCVRGASSADGSAALFRARPGRLGLQHALGACVRKMPSAFGGGPRSSALFHVKHPGDAQLSHETPVLLTVCGNAARRDLPAGSFHGGRPRTRAFGLWCCRILRLRLSVLTSRPFVDIRVGGRATFCVGGRWLQTFHLFNS